MDITSGISAARLDAYSQRTGDAVTMSTMKKAMDIQAQNAALLISSAMQSLPQQAALPQNLGQNINVKV